MAERIRDDKKGVETPDRDQNKGEKTDNEIKPKIRSSSFQSRLDELFRKNNNYSDHINADDSSDDDITPIGRVNSQANTTKILKQNENENTKNLIHNGKLNIQISPKDITIRNPDNYSCFIKSDKSPVAIGQKKNDDDLKRFYSVSEGGFPASTGLSGYPYLPEFTGVTKNGRDAKTNDTKTRQDINHMILDTPISNPEKPGPGKSRISDTPKPVPGYQTPNINATKKRQDINNMILDDIHINTFQSKNGNLDTDRRQSSPNMSTNFVSGYSGLTGFTDKKFNINAISLDEINDIGDSDEDGFMKKYTPPKEIPQRKLNEFLAYIKNPTEKNKALGVKRLERSIDDALKLQNRLKILSICNIHNTPNNGVRLYICIFICHIALKYVFSYIFIYVYIACVYTYLYTYIYVYIYIYIHTYIHV
jgi:hypothetical protein